ncbi:hypothetical protein IWW38_005608, partial [Coemansia aciculifera]
MSSIDTTTTAATSVVYVLRFTTSLSSQGLVLQSNATTTDAFRPFTDCEDAIQRSLESSTLPRTQDRDGRFAPLALARVAPLGLLAKIVSLPETYLDDLEERILDTWSLAFGYSRQFLATAAPLQTEQLDSPGSSSLVWVTLNDDSEPMLYPRRLILVDRSSFQTKAPDHSHEPTTLTTVEPIGLDAYVPKLPDTAIISGDSALDVAGSKPTPNAMRSDSSELSELEEGEDFEDGEEGEISDPAESIPVAPRAVPVDSELDAVVGSLHPDAPSVPELSLTAIRES